MKKSRPEPIACKAYRMKEQNGYLTVFLTLILTVMLSLCLTLVLGARESARKMKTEYVTDIGMNSILAEYHRELLEQYDLFFIDTSYGTSLASYEKTAEHLSTYLTYNLGDEGIFLPILYRDPLKLELDNAEITEASVATDEEGAVLRRQAVDVMYQRIGVTFLREVAEWVRVADAYDMDSRDILAEEREAAAQLEAWNGTTIETADGEREVELENPGAAVVSFWEAGVLNFVVEDIDTLSSVSVDKTAYVSGRELLAGTGLNSALAFEDGFWEQLLFHEYILEYTGRFDKEKEDGLLRYQTEYILAGKENDVENLKNIVYKLLAFRAVANTVYLTGDTEKMNLLRLTTRILATLIGLPAIAGVLQTILVLAWAMAESIYDVEQLLKGKRILLMKTKTSWHYDLDQVMNFTGEHADEGGESGLRYEDYLRVFLCFQDKKVTTFRLMDVMEMDIRKTPGNLFFRMDGCIDSLKASIGYKSRDGKEYSIVRSYGY